MHLLISFVQSPSADLYDPRNLKSCTCSSDSPSFKQQQPFYWNISATRLD